MFHYPIKQIREERRLVLIPDMNHHDADADEKMRFCAFHAQIFVTSFHINSLNCLRYAKARKNVCEVSF